MNIVETGVSNFTTGLSTDPLAWMIAHVPKYYLTAGDKPFPDSRIFYLQQPPSVDMRHNTSVQACASIFTGIAPKLKFNYTETTVQTSKSRGTCNDALATQCVSDWTQQVHDMASQMDESIFSCKQLTDELQAKPPASCQVAKKSWGDITAKVCSTVLLLTANRTSLNRN